MINKDFSNNSIRKYPNSNYIHNKDPEEKETERKPRFGFELGMPVFERIVCKDPETKEQNGLINFLVFIFFIIMLCLPALPSIGRIIYKLGMFFR